jgi:phytoene synthase
LAVGVEFDEVVRRADPDRWLASRFIGDPTARADVVALYAFDFELERARRVTSSALTTEIRLTWWWDVVGEIFESGLVREHPLAQALGAVVRRRSLRRELLEAMVEARLEIIGTVSMDGDEAVRWADGAHGSAAALAASVLGAGAQSHEAKPAGRLIGVAGLVRDGRLAAETGSALMRSMLAAADAAARALPARAFPAVAAAALARRELTGARPSELERRLRLAVAVARGRV